VVSAAEIATLTEQVRQLTEVARQLASTMVPKVVCEERCRARRREDAELHRRVEVLEQRPVRWWPIVVGVSGVLVAAAALVVSLTK
jgi:hypothetical protein